MIEIQERFWCPAEAPESAASLRRRIKAHCEAIGHSCRHCRHAVLVRCVVYSNALKQAKASQLNCST